MIFATRISHYIILFCILVFGIEFELNNRNHVCVINKIFISCAPSLLKAPSKSLIAKSWYNRQHSGDIYIFCIDSIDRLVCVHHAYTHIVAYWTVLSWTVLWCAVPRGAVCCCAIQYGLDDLFKGWQWQKKCDQGKEITYSRKRCFITSFMYARTAIA